MNKRNCPQNTTPPPASDALVALKKNHKLAWEEVKDKIIDALAAGETITTVARLSGVRRETLSRWLHSNPVFIAELNEKKNEKRKEAIGCINAIVGKTAEALKIALSHPDINPTAVVQSIMSMLPKMYGALLEQKDLETNPAEIMLDRDVKNTLTERKFIGDPAQIKAMLKNYEKIYEGLLEHDHAEDTGEPRELLDYLENNLDGLNEKTTPYSFRVQVQT